MKQTDTVLLTGGSGFIGGRLLRNLAAAGYDVDAPSRSTLDLEDRAAVARYVAASKAHIVINLASPAMRYVAAQTEADAVQAIAREVMVAETLAGAAAQGTRFIQAGSMAEYGYGGRHAEDALCRPVSAYGRAKHAAGHAVLAIAEARNLDATVVRIFGAYGTGESARRLFPQLLSARYHEDSIPLSDGKQLRDFIHVDDVCDAIIRLLARPALFQSVYNLGTGHAVTVRMAVERIAIEAGIAASRLRFGQLQRSALDETCLEADSARLATTLGWCPPQRFAAGEPLLRLFA